MNSLKQRNEKTVT